MIGKDEAIEAVEDTGLEVTGGAETATHWVLHTKQSAFGVGPVVVRKRDGHMERVGSGPGLERVVGAARNLFSN